MSSQWKKRYQKEQQRRKVPSNRAALEEAKFFREQNTELTERMRHLINALSKWDIDVSWDGLRHFWSIELTESGRTKRDRAYKAEAENDKLRNLVTEMHSFITSLPSSVRDYDDPLGNWEYTMQELGIEVD